MKNGLSYTNEAYKQTDGVSMGSSIEPVLTSIITHFEVIVVHLMSFLWA